MVMTLISSSFVNNTVLSVLMVISSCAYAFAPTHALGASRGAQCALVTSRNECDWGEGLFGSGAGVCDLISNLINSRLALRLSMLVVLGAA